MTEEICDIRAIVTNFFCPLLFGGASAPLREADGEADRWESPIFCKDCPQGANSQPGTPPGAARRNRKPARSRKPCRKPGKAGVTKGWWSGWRLAATVVAFTFRRAQSVRVDIKRSNFMPVPETTEKPANSRNIWKMLLC